MDVREDRDGKFLADLCEDVQSAVEAGASETVYTGSIGLIETGFEYKANAQLGGEVLERCGYLEAEVFALDHTGTGHEDQGSAWAYGTLLNVDVAYGEGFHVTLGGHDKLCRLDYPVYKPIGKSEERFFAALRMTAGRSE